MCGIGRLAIVTFTSTTHTHTPHTTHTHHTHHTHIHTNTHTHTHTHIYIYIYGTLSACPHFLLHATLSPSLYLSLSHRSGREKEEGEREREGEKERLREKSNMYFNSPELLFLFLKGMTGALAPFSYLIV